MQIIPWLPLNAFNIHLAYNCSLNHVNNSTYSKEGLSTQEGFTDFWQIEIQLKDTTFSNKSDLKMLLTNSQFLRHEAQIIFSLKTWKTEVFK